MFSIVIFYNQSTYLGITEIADLEENEILRMNLKGGRYKKSDKEPRDF